MGRSHISAQIRRLGPEMPTSLCLILYLEENKETKSDGQVLWLFVAQSLRRRKKNLWKETNGSTAQTSLDLSKMPKKKRININAILPFIENSNRKLALVVFPEEIMFWAFKPSQVSLMWPCLGCFDKCFANSHVCWCLGGTKLLFALIGGNQQSG